MRAPRILKARILLPLGLVGLGAAGAVLLLATQPRLEPRTQQAPAPLIRAMEVQPQSVRLTIRTHGTVEPRTESNLVPEVSGPVVWKSPAFVDGGLFEEGDPLVRIDPVDYEVALERARAKASRALSEHRRALKQLKRRRGLADRDAASAAQLDDAVNDERVAEADLREARAEVARAEHDLARTEIRAPFVGRVREKRVDRGEFVSRGTPIARLFAIDYAEVRLPVPSQELGYLELPAPDDYEVSDTGAEVRLQGELAGETFHWRGRVVRTEGEVDPRSRMLNVVARIEDPYARREGTDQSPLPVGMFVEAEILGRRVEPVFVLPRSALRAERRVLVLDDESRLRFRDVHVLRESGDEVVISKGLEAGERICISPLEVVVDGMRVRLAQAQESS